MVFQVTFTTTILFETQKGEHSVSSKSESGLKLFKEKPDDSQR